MRKETAAERDQREQRNELTAAMAERWQQRFADTVRGWGGQERLFDYVRAKRNADPDFMAAEVLTRLLHAGARTRGPLRIRQCDRARLDAPLLAYFESVAAGASGWNDERRRIREMQSACFTGDKRALDVYAIRDMLPGYRAWGQLLLDAVRAGAG